VGTKRLSLGTNRPATKDPWVRNDWIPTWIRLIALHEAKQERIFKKQQGGTYIQLPNTLLGMKYCVKVRKDCS